MNTSMPGQEGIPSVFSPMARTLEDLVYFSRSLIGIKPWLWDHSVHPIEWRSDEERKMKETKSFKIGIMRTDGRPFRRGSVSRKEEFVLNHFQESLIHPRPALVHSNEPYPLSPPKVTPLSKCHHPPRTTLSSSALNYSTPTAAARSSHFFEPAKPTIPALVKCRYT